MGRYDGEEYAPREMCLSDAHTFAMNGSCSRCGRTREGLVAMATAHLQQLAPNRLLKSWRTKTDVR